MHERTQVTGSPLHLVFTLLTQIDLSPKKKDKKT